MSKKLHWIREAFSRAIIIIDGENEVGRLSRQSLVSYDMEATLNQAHLLFDVKGFIRKTVDVIDLNQNNKVIGIITFSFARKAELVLATGEKYLWRRQNFLMRRWNLIKISGDSSTEILHYNRLKEFFSDKGDIEGSVKESDSEILILTGLFLGGYFLRKQRMARAGAAS